MWAEQQRPKSVPVRTGLAAWNRAPVSPGVSGTVYVVTTESDWLLADRLRRVGLRVRVGRVLPDRQPQMPDIVVIDARTPGLDVLSTVRGLRADAAAAGVVVVGEHGPTDEALTCALLVAGADDVLCLPLQLDEVVARLRALLRRINPVPGSSVPICTGVSLHADCRTVEWEGRHIFLTRTEFDLMAVLADPAGRVVTRQHLLATVWGLPHGTRSNVLNMCVFSLRRKLTSHEVPTLIDTVRGLGFRLRTDR